ncbi:MAG: haloacid dehalogenase type II [Verrucomicrobia bacterium]|nr:haloacid dehalogenase type II [Verrucomicrobiota bacterium]
MNEPQVIGFDIYGTLVDPLAVAVALRPYAGDQAGRFAELWREKQIEYAFRRALMRNYQPFDVCTRDALACSAQALNINLEDRAFQDVLGFYQRLPVFADAAFGLEALRAGGHRLYAFSNGSRQSIESLLGNGSLLAHFDGIVSADSVHSFKPDPAVYLHFFRTVNGRPGRVWLVSANPWDVIGAKSAGLRAAWLNRGGTKIFDPWGMAPDVTLATLGELAAFLAHENGRHVQTGAPLAQDGTPT